MKSRRKLDLTLKFKCQTREELDQILERDYKLLRENPPIQDYIDKTQTRRNNKLILDYVHLIYDEYSIQNPLKGVRTKLDESVSSQSDSRKKSKLSLSKDFQQENSQKKGQSRQIYHIGGKHKHSHASSKSETSRLDSSRVKFTYETPKQKLDTSIPQSPSRFNGVQSRFNSVDSRFNTVDQRIKRSFNQGENPFRSTIASDSRAQNMNPEDHTLRNTMKPGLPGLPGQTNKYVPQIYRYCIGCDQPLLETNIRHHQKICTEFQNIFQMTCDQMLGYLETKIKLICQKASRKSYDLPDQSIHQFKKYSSKAVSDSQENRVITPRFCEFYQKSMNIGRKFCESLEEVNRLNWFMKIREHLQKALGKI